MCEFCTKHGEGKRWYLQAKNYSQELLRDKKRLKFIIDFMNGFEKDHAKKLHLLDKYNDLPLLGKIIRRAATAYQKREHFGQVVPLEEVEKILELANSHTLLPCVCRSLLRGRNKENYCFALTFASDQTLQEYPEFKDVEDVGKDEALKLVKEFDKKGTVHSIWTFITPYIGGLCNCTAQDCVAIKTEMLLKTRVMFKAEFVGRINWENCNGCRNCMKVCQFNAISYSNSQKRCFINENLCYGCGICRAVCNKESISLIERNSIPLLKYAF